MTRLQFRYYMRLSFTESVKNHRFTLKCIPNSDERQQISITEFKVRPNSFINDTVDSFGNLVVYGYEECEHNQFEFEIKGNAKTDINGLNKTESDDILRDSQISLFKYQTEITRPGELILEYYNMLENKESEALDYAMHITQTLGNDFMYVSNSTDIQTTAEEAMNKKIGVCQDYAHIMLSLCRLRKIPCRYVTGMMTGEGASHAWVEVFADNKWIGMDPTNASIVDEHYIKIAHGRDYKDCLVNRGIFNGNVIQTQEVSVNVEVLEETGELK